MEYVCIEEFHKNMETTFWRLGLRGIIFEMKENQWKMKWET